MTGVKELAARIRNLFTTGSISRRNGAKVQIVDRFGNALEQEELFPYGFASRPLKGTALLLFEGGDSRSPALVFVSDQEKAPALEDGESALWNDAGARVIARKDGTIEINGKNFGGLIKIEELKAQLEKNREILQTFLAVLATPVNEPGAGNPSAFQAALLAALAGKVPGNYSNIENAKVNHGDGSA